MKEAEPASETCFINKQTQESVQIMYEFSEKPSLEVL
jgi:hypothetical protein